MPTYDMKNVKTGEVKEMFLKIAEKEAMIESGEWEQVITSAYNIVTHVGGVLKTTPQSWREHLKNVKTASGRGNTIKV